jgi:hypothetical protein
MPARDADHSKSYVPAELHAISLFVTQGDF